MGRAESMATTTLSEAAVKHLMARRQGLSEAADNWRPTWEQIQKYAVPWMGRSLSGKTETEWNSGREKNWTIYNETAGESLEILAAGMMGGLSSPSRPWKVLQILGDPELSNWYPVRSWLDQTNRLMDMVFAGSNIYLSLHATYKELAAFATAATALIDDPETMIHGRPYTCGEYWLATDGRGRVNTFWREYYPTVGEMVSEFGKDAVSTSTLNKFEQGNLEQRVGVMWVIEPNDTRFEVPASRRFPFRSIFFEGAIPSGGKMEAAGSVSVLRVGGFHDFPIMTPRWDVTSNDVYGTGPYFTHLPAIRLLQELEKNGLKALKRIVSPPTKGFGITKDDIDLSDDGFTEVDNPESQITPLFNVNYDVQANEAKIERLQTALRKGLFSDLFMMISNTPVRSERETEAQIAAKQQEKMSVLGPMIERVHPELLDRVVRRTYRIMRDAGILPEAPQEIRDSSIEVQYVSMLAQAMKMAGLANLERFTSYVGAVAQYDQSVLDKVDSDKLVEEYHSEIGAPARVLRPDDAVAQLRASRQQAAAQQAASEQALNASKSARQLSASQIGDQNALEAIVNEARGASA